MRFNGRFTVTHYRNGRALAEYHIKNGIVDEGKNRILDVMFHGTAASDPWYIGLIDNDGYVSLSDADTMASHAGWTELTTYSEITRQTWDENAAANQEMTTATVAVYSINADNSDIRGLFIVDDITKGGAIGLLWSTGLFDSILNLNNGDTLKVEYELAVT